MILQEIGDPERQAVEDDAGFLRRGAGSGHRRGAARAFHLDRHFVEPRIEVAQAPAPPLELDAQPDTVVRVAVAVGEVVGQRLAVRAVLLHLGRLVVRPGRVLVVALELCGHRPVAGARLQRQDAQPDQEQTERLGAREGKDASSDASTTDDPGRDRRLGQRRASEPRTEAGAEHLRSVRKRLRFEVPSDDVAGDGHVDDQRRLARSEPEATA